MKPVTLVEALELRGIEIGGANKAMSLSSMLSKDKRFQPDRKWGWSLKRAPLQLQLEREVILNRVRPLTQTAATMSCEEVRDMAHIHHMTLRV